MNRTGTPDLTMNGLESTSGPAVYAAAAAAALPAMLELLGIRHLAGPTTESIGTKHRETGAAVSLH